MVIAFFKAQKNTDWWNNFFKGWNFKNLFPSPYNSLKLREMSKIRHWSSKSFRGWLHYFFLWSRGVNLCVVNIFRIPFCLCFEYVLWSLIWMVLDRMSYSEMGCTWACSLNLQLQLEYIICPQYVYFDDTTLVRKKKFWQVCLFWILLAFYCYFVSGPSPLSFT